MRNTSSSLCPSLSGDLRSMTEMTAPDPADGERKSLHFAETFRLPLALLPRRAYGPTHGVHDA
jgi:hypothetical protein